MRTGVAPTTGGRFQAAAGAAGGGVLFGAVSGALVFLLCSVICFGQGLVSHWSLLPDAYRGAVIGGLIGLLQATRQWRSITLVAASGVLTTVGTTSWAAYMLSRPEAMAETRAEALAVLERVAAFHLVAAALTAAALLSFRQPVRHGGTRPAAESRRAMESDA